MSFFSLAHAETEAEGREVASSRPALATSIFVMPSGCRKKGSCKKNAAEDDTRFLLNGRVQGKLNLIDEIAALSASRYPWHAQLRTAC